MTSWPHGDPNVVARDVLAGSAYNHAPLENAHPPPHAWWEALWGWLLEHVVRPIFAPLAHALSGAAGSGLGAAVAIGFVVISLSLLGFVAYRLATAFVREPRAASRAIGLRSLASARDSAAWRVLAREAATSGDYARAIAYVFSAALALLDERAVVAFDAARTPGEYRRVVRRERLPAASSFDDLAVGFVRASYAAERPDAGDYATVTAAFDRFEPALRS